MPREPRRLGRVKPPFRVWGAGASGARSGEACNLVLMPGPTERGNRVQTRREAMQQRRALPERVLENQMFGRREKLGGAGFWNDPPRRHRRRATPYVCRPRRAIPDPGRADGGQGPGARRRREFPGSERLGGPGALTGVARREIQQRDLSNRAGWTGSDGVSGRGSWQSKGCGDAKSA